jgi:hypothetical protein
MTHIAFITHYDMDGVSSYRIAKHAFNQIHPNAQTDMKCGGYDKVTPNLRILAESGNDILVITDLQVLKDDLKFALKHWKTVYLFDHHLDSAKYEPLAKTIPERFIYYYDVNMSATAIVYKWAICEQNINSLKTQNWKKLVGLVNTYDLWKTDRPDWQEAYDLNELFWHKNFWKFGDKFCDTGFVPPSAHDKSTIKRLKAEKIKILMDSPKEAFGNNGAFFFLSDQAAINACEFECPDIDYFFIAYPRGDSADLGLSIRAREGSMISAPPAMNVNDVVELGIKNYPQVIESGGGHEFAGGAVIYKGVNIMEVKAACKFMYGQMQPENEDIAF